MSEPDEEKLESERRTTINLVAAVAILLLIIGGYWLINFLDQKRKLEACLESGRQNCLSQFDPAAAPPR